jgi:hypothetical protein
MEIFEKLACLIHDRKENPPPVPIPAPFLKRGKIR